jgi:hypothetical protein
MLQRHIKTLLNDPQYIKQKFFIDAGNCIFKIPLNSAIILRLYAF